MLETCFSRNFTGGSLTVIWKPSLTLYLRLLCLIMFRVFAWGMGAYSRGTKSVVAGGHGPLNFLEIVGFSEILMLRQKIFELLLCVKIKVSIGATKPLGGGGT